MRASTEAPPQGPVPSHGPDSLAGLVRVPTCSPSILGTAAGLPTPQPRLVLFEMSHLTKAQRGLLDQRLRAQGYATAGTMRSVPHPRDEGVARYIASHGDSDILYAKASC